MYSLLNKLLFCLPTETSHSLALRSIAMFHRIGLTKHLPKPPRQPQTLMGLDFPNKIGLAAGLDKNADYINGLGALGFGFIEIGTITPKPQSGNPKPRLFRLVKEQAIINRMGFNNKGADYVAKQLAKTHYRGILGINIGKNRDTPNERAIDDYVICFRKLWPYASYITINISSPNTAGLRDLQQVQALSQLLATLKQEQQCVHQQHQRYIPLVVKISPDLSLDALADIANTLLEHKIDGVIATNTTVDREAVKDSSLANEAGGLSGKPLTSRSTAIVKALHEHLQDKIPIIASGGIMSRESIQEKLSAGAKLVQVYTGFIYAGLGLLSYPI